MTLQDEYESIGKWPDEKTLPIVYDRRYNIALCGLEKCSKLDAWKLDKIFSSLVKKQVLPNKYQSLLETVVPVEVLEDLHDKTYLNSLQTSNMALVRITELPSLICLPNFLNQRWVLNPLKFQTSGTILAVGLAIERGWAINIGGGLIHAIHDRGAAWCPYDDITLSIRFARKRHAKIRKVMIIDLGARQGNGYASNKLKFQDQDIIIVDVYNEIIFPQDLEARKAINVERKLSCGATSEAYMKAVNSAIKEASEYEVDLIIYAAGSNVLEQDYTGQIRATSEDLISRDEMVFRFAKLHSTPICMVTSSGYGFMNFETVSASIENLVKNVCN